ncbi:hypothetical protein RUM43_005855 [Polyplax serrata]|uniref:Uncharacterized protein n=1 Tax=Polyplax serrata TaxID=468196 RepID=A0AAN8RUZ7_POLSC
MEVVPIRVPKTNGPTTTVGLPFNRRNVEEWSRIDRLTGIMETAKIETDHWNARTNNAAHNYGKVVDSRERNAADGSLQERQRKQMEVFQTKVPGGSMQVIRTQTITTSSKKWSSTSDKGFDDLQLPVNSLDLSSQKTKGSVGRSGSIGGRRPPTRPRSLFSQSSSGNVFGEESSMFKLRQRLHQQSEMEPLSEVPSFSCSKKESDTESDSYGVVITDVTSPVSSESSVKNSLTRQKSSSNENITLESNQDSLLRRSSKFRRSLQCHRPNYTGLEPDPADEYDPTPAKSLKERAAEIEKLLRQGNSTYITQNCDLPTESYGKVKFLKTKESFVSPETLKEVRDRLKKPNVSDNETKDDGIVTEKNEYGPPSKTNSYGQELQATNASNKKPNINGTGSLESRYTNRSSVNGARTSEWYRRRKSYGFEQVDEYDKFGKINTKKKNHIDSSTDSGICQSSETMGVPLWNKNADSIWTKISSENNSNEDPLSHVVTVRVKKDPKDMGLHSQSSFSHTKHNSFEKGINSIYLDGQSGSFPSRREDRKEDFLTKESVWNRKSPVSSYQKASEDVKPSLRPNKNPWISQLRGTKLVDRNWISDEIGNQEDTMNKSNADNSILPPKEDGDFNNQKKNKKVEFCKTEVHFAAESGKFNIVETDGKPPPNDMFRRRRRSSGSTGSIKDTSGLPQTKFGDSPILQKTALTKPEKVESISEKIEAELKELSRIVIEALPKSETPENEGFKRKNSWLYDVVEEPVENGEVDDGKVTAGLKNYRNPVLSSQTDLRKPKRSEVNENISKSPIPASVPVWQSTVVLRNKRFDNVKRDDDRKMYASDGESELLTRIRNLRKTDSEQKLWGGSPYNSTNDRISEMKRRSLPNDFLLRNNSGTAYGNDKMSVSTDETPMLSVAERIKQVEQFKSNNYSTKINFRSGEMTVVQNGTSTIPEEQSFDNNRRKTMTTWAHQRKIGTFDDAKKEDHKAPLDQSGPMCDELTTSNPPVMRFSTHDDKTDNKKYQTTRILINFKTSAKNEASKKPEVVPLEKINNNNNNKSSAGHTISTNGSWSSGKEKDIGRCLNELKSANLVKDTIHLDNSESQLREDIPKPTKPVHEIIDQFDSLSRKFKEKCRKPIPSVYRPSKEYTHSDLEEELKNFTENLDKDFRDIYEEEIGSFRKSRSLRESVRKSDNTGKVDNFVRPVIQKRSASCNLSTKSSSDEASKKSSVRTSSRDNYDTDDSDLLADEEVRSYMSAGQAGSESEPEEVCGSTSSRKSFEDSILRFKKLESQTKRQKETKTSGGISALSTSAIYPKSNSLNRTLEPKREPNKSPKIASIALKYEDDPFFSKTTMTPKSATYAVSNTSSNDLSTDAWDRTSNSSSAMSTKPRERVSYLNGLSLSEKYLKYLHRSSNSSTDTVSDSAFNRTERTPGVLFNGAEEQFPRSKFETCHKSRVSNRDYLVSPVKDDEVKKRESIANEKTSQIKYPKSEQVESSRSRIKSSTERQSSHKTSSEKLRDYRTNGVKRKERRQTDGAMEELKRAAEEIIMAVNGYTDDSSLVGSSEDDRPKRIIKKDKIGNLGTISEGKRVTKTDPKVTTSSTVTHGHSRRMGHHSSASSTESLNQKDSYKATRELKASSRYKHGEITKTSTSRSARLHHRATREATIGHPSSSEDIPSCVEQVKRRVVRRQKTSSSTKPEIMAETKSSSSRQKPKVKEELLSSLATRTTRSEKVEKVKEMSSGTRSARTIRSAEGDKTKSSSKKSTTEKQSDMEAIKRRRSQRSATKHDQTPTQM